MVTIPFPTDEALDCHHICQNPVILPKPELGSKILNQEVIFFGRKSPPQMIVVVRQKETHIDQIDDDKDAEKNCQRHNGPRVLTPYLE